MVHGLGLSLWLHHPQPVQGAGVEAGLDLELALFAPAGASQASRPSSAPDTKAAPSEEPPTNAETPDLPQPEAAPLPQPEPAPTLPIDESSPPEAKPEPLGDNIRVAAEPEPPAEPERETTPKSQPEPDPRPLPKPQPKLQPKRADQSHPPKPPAAAKRTSRSAQAASATPLQAPLESPPDAHPSTTAASLGDQRSSSTGTTSEGAFLAELQRAIKRHQRYPEQARREDREGSATLSFVLQADGRLEKVQLSRSSGDRELDQAAIESLQRLGRFRPIPLELSRGPWPLSIVIRFNLR